MKALILAAGMGTRLLPYTRYTPKPLFTLNQRPVLDLIVGQLFAAGCRAALVNTHHHHEQIEAFIAERNYPMPVRCSYEPEILGTGGAIRNIADFWSDEPLLIINADIVTDIDLGQVYQFHIQHPDPVTMVMHDYPQFNGVWVDAADYITGFDETQPPEPICKRLAFTGIHVIHRRVLDFIPTTGPSHIISAYTRMLQAGEPIKALVVHGHHWRDIGTPESYRAAVLEHMAPAAFERAFGNLPNEQIRHQALAGDGSDRRWSRLSTGPMTLVMAEHGIRGEQQGTQEVDAFVDIGTHLQSRAVPVPRIHLYDRFSGVVFMEDLGDLNLQHAVVELPPKQRKRVYEQVIHQWLNMAFEGAKGFDTRWTCQTPYYDRNLILDRECRYFIEAFVNTYLATSVAYPDFAAEFQWLADNAINFSITGFIHRDLQSRNIMLHEGQIHFIDFQGSRLGPIQYDLASLLIDPYVGLAPDFQDELVRHAVKCVSKRNQIDPDRFMAGYTYCSLTRNFQILGAFGFLSRIKNKPFFEAFIPSAVETLRRNLSKHSAFLPRLADLVEEITGRINS